MKTKFNLLQKFMLAYCSIVVALSCSTDDRNKVIQNQINALDFRHEVSQLFNSYEIIKEDFSNPNFLFRNSEVIDQESLNEYLAVLGLESDYISINDVNTIISELSEFESQDDVEEYIENSNYTGQTKGLLIQLTEGNAIDNLSNLPGFDELEISEKQILTLSNDIIEEFENRNMGDITAPCPGEACTTGMMIIGTLIGGGICGLPCAIGGGLVGLLIGITVKN